jgi:hypothetical protein
MIENEADRKSAGLYDRAMARFEGRSAPAPTPQPREREASGQFRSNERVFGQEKIERDAGYRPLPKDRTEPEGLSVHDAAIERAKEMQTKPIEVHESGLKDNVTLSVEQAATRIEEARKADVDQAALDSTKAQQEAVDKLRAATPETQPQQQPQLSEVDVDRAVNHPRVQKIITEKMAEAETQRQHFETSVQEVGKMRVAALVSFAPELSNLPLNQWANAINAMHQREPARAKQVFSMLQAVGEVENAVIQMNAQKAAREKSEFANYTTRETQRFKEMTRGIAPQRMAAIKSEIPNMLAACGVADPRSFLTAIQGQTVFPRASAEMIMMKAAMYDMAMRTPRPQATRAVPPVQRPGVAGPRVNPANSAIQALNARLSATGDIKDATKLLLAKRTTAKRGR